MTTAQAKRKIWHAIVHREGVAYWQAKLLFAKLPEAEQQYQINYIRENS